MLKKVMVANLDGYISMKVQNCGVNRLVIDLGLWITHTDTLYLKFDLQVFC